MYFDPWVFAKGAAIALGILTAGGLLTWALWWWSEREWRRFS